MGRKNRTPKATVATLEVNKPSKADLSFTLSRKVVLYGILAITFLAFSNTLFNGFAYDDTTQILQNPLIRSFTNLPDALTKEVWFWRADPQKDPNKQVEPTTPYYRPVFTVYLMIGWHLFGDQPFGWHLLNILMHLIGVYFAFLILEKITNDLRVTGIATLLFAVHPLRSESVAWISGSTDLFLALFLLPSFYLYIRYRENRQIKYLNGSLGLFLLAAFAKEPAVAMPVFIAAYEMFIINQEKSFKEKLKPIALYSILFALLMVGYFEMRYKALGFVLSDENFRIYPIEWVLLTIPLAITKYLGLLFFPMNLSIFHQTIMVKSVLSYRFYVPVLLLLALAFGLWQLRHSIAARFAILWFFIHLLPVLNLSAFDENFLIQERYVYIPSLGFSLLIAMLLVNIPIEQWLAVGNRRKAQAAMVGLIALLFTGKTFAQNLAWKNDLTLWEHSVAVASDQPMASFILGHQYIKYNQWQKVIDNLERYVELKPSNPVVLSNLAAAHLQMYEANRDRAHVVRAIALCEQGLKLDDRLASLWDTLGHAYSYDTDLKNYTRARLYFNQALQIEPDLPIALFHMGATFYKEGAFDDALRLLERARNLQPDFIDIYKFLGYTYALRGDLQKGIDTLNYYMQKAPTAPEIPLIKQDLEKYDKLLQEQQAAGLDPSAKPVGAIAVPDKK
ncbi:MAG: tetratricopeptide repeat protein [Acidobacteriota bacterium]